MTFDLKFVWYDFWVGGFWDSGKRRLYVCLVPCLPIIIQFASPKVIS